jgi:hypothetical protein
MDDPFGPGLCRGRIIATAPSTLARSMASGSGTQNR